MEDFESESLASSSMETSANALEAMGLGPGADNEDINHDSNIDSAEEDEKQSELNGNANSNSNGNTNSNAKPKTKSKAKKINFVPPPNKIRKFETLDPVLVKKTLLIVNTFVVNTCAFLNTFVSTCESKLHNIHNDVSRMEITLSILEGKLNSIDWIRDTSNLPTAEQMNANRQLSGNKNANNEEKEEEPGAEEERVPEAPKEDPLLSDPEMQRWFKMLKVGVPGVAVRNKMIACGFESDVVERLIVLGSK